MNLFTDGFKELKKANEPLYKTPKSIQQTIEISKVAENGIFEVGKGKAGMNRFSKCYRFHDVNYATTDENEQMGIFERYCKFLNSLDVCFKITVNNKNKDMEQVREYIFYRKKKTDTTTLEKHTMTLWSRKSRLESRGLSRSGI